MTVERLTVQVESNIGEDGPLTVNDALRQFIDAFDLVTAAICEEQGGEAVKWRLVAMSKNSPATATAEAYSVDPSIEAGPIAHRGKRRFVEGMNRLSNGTADDWIFEKASLAKSFLRRNLNGVGRTTIDAYNDLPRPVIVEKTARSGLNALELRELQSQFDDIDLSREEWGSIEANVSEAKTYYSQPALYVKERKSLTVIPCVLSEEAARDAGPTHNWSEVWTGKRVRIRGQIFYNKLGQISRIRATKIHDIQPAPVRLSDIRNIDLTEGRSPNEHLSDFWDGKLG
ncbi:hypothetical protein SI859A1_02935 [Aurantimonas manganoxydans SI85-9A1]|uniref:Uncharacterized protein n=1 Tax=Aurantimonas manganoxydans (strain ATCC BAA-1229 / DSM 21871 / SI85-9A1) TaxID=287752 RepID=Q1YG91_AURMS|nr:hypothetical protein [Aurantimonas manganoxydans]EAS49334.1 hypothetical protein SI859A1_02935 [Aurantimonas manganoxydans SI85-9A1]